jgi:hypothetical protein
MMATAKQLQDAAAFYVGLGMTEVIGTYETDEGKWVNVYFTDRDEKTALETDLFGRVLAPDEIDDNGRIEVHKRHFLN